MTRQNSDLGRVADRGGQLPLFGRTLAGSTARDLGAYYTPTVAASFLARWAIRRGTERILEPAMGEGEFLRAIARHAADIGATEITRWGVELAADTHAATLAAGVVEPSHAVLGDFLGVEPFPVDVVIGNPPYVRLRHLPKVEADRARIVAEQALGRPMEADGSLWMPFVLHSTRFLALGGRLALVLPYELTYVRYARPLWSFLGQRFRSIRLIRVRARLFADLLQDVVLLLADGFGSGTSTVEFEALETAADLDGGRLLASAEIPLDRVVAGDRPFAEALLPLELRELLASKLHERTVPMREIVTFNIGYVAGDKNYFHPDASAVTRYRLPNTSLVDAVTSSRKAAGAGLWTSAMPTAARSRLFLPPKETAVMTEGEYAYVALGEQLGVSARYKCRTREPWFVTPDVRIPDVLLPVFADHAALLINDARLAASNSLLAGYLRRGGANDLAAAWYCSLTLLEIELRVHSLGGGVMVFVPRETGSIRVVTTVNHRHLRHVDSRLRERHTDDAYLAGDEALRTAAGLDGNEISLVRSGVDVLRAWRTGRR